MSIAYQIESNRYRSCTQNDAKQIEVMIVMFVHYVYEITKVSTQKSYEAFTFSHKKKEQKML